MFLQHIAVQRKGIWYKLHVFDQYGKILSPQVFEKQFQWIINDADANKGLCSNNYSSQLFSACPGRFSNTINQWFLINVLTDTK